MKIAPDLADADVDAVADLALELGLDGIIATNTTIAPRRRCASDAGGGRGRGAGGLSGAPLAARSLAVLRRLRARVGDRLVLIAVGGIETPDDAWARLRAGATLVQAYTGFIYGGPLWPAACTRARGARPPRRVRDRRRCDRDGRRRAEQDGSVARAAGPGGGRRLHACDGRRTPQTAGFPGRATRGTV